MNKSSLCLGVAFLALVGGVHAAITAGDVVGIDFGNDAGQTADWNNLASPGDDIAAGSLVRANDGAVVAGVAFTTVVPGANTGENSGATVSASYPGIPNSAQNDDWYESNAGQSSFTFTGLDDNLTYDLTVGCYWIGGTAVQQENRNTGWQIGAAQTNTIADDPDGCYVTFEGVSSSGGALTVSTWDYNSNEVSTVSALQLTAVGAATNPPAEVVEISIDFGETAPATPNWNQFTSAGGSTTLENLVRRSDGLATGVGLTVSGITSDAGLNHLEGGGSTDPSIYVDHIFAQNESPDDTLSFTFFGLNDSLTYELFGGFKRDNNRFEHIWAVGPDVRTNTFDGAYVDGYETFAGVSPSGGEITFTISDLDTGDDWASIAELTLTAIPTGNVPPTATAQSVTTLPGTPVDITLGGSDWEGSNLTYSVDSQPTHGVLLTNGALPDLTYTPANGFTGLDSFTFSVSDGELSSGPATVSVAVTNMLPVAHAQRVRVLPGTPMDITLAGSDADGPSNLTYSVASPTHGVLGGTEPNLTYTPDPGFDGDDSFTFTVNDGLADSAPATVSITVASNGPNFIIFFTDDQGYNDLGCFGSPHIQTPRFDRMAAEGMRFTDAYVASPVCGPSRAGLLTGSYPIRIAEPSNEKNHHTEPHGDEVMIPELLKTAGYTSALIGKWHNSGESTTATSFHAGRGPIDQGFDYFYGTPSHNGTKAVDTGTNVKTSILRADTNGTTVVDADLTQAEADYMIYNYTREAQNFMTNSVNKNQPFFLWLAHNMPHVSLGARQEFRDRAAARGQDVYTAVIEELDWSLGEILDTLDDLGIAENTFVIFSSDNGPWEQASLEGYYGSAFPLRGSKMRPLEGGPRVPFMVRWPGTVPTNTVSEEVVTTMDLFPTFMDYARVDMPDGLEIDGKSIRGLVEGTATVSPHDYYYYYCYTYLYAIRDARWKLALPRRNSPSANWMKWWGKWIDRVDEVELYDLDNDPEETTNLAAQYPEVVKRFLDQAEVARAELGDKDRIGSGARFFDGGSLRPDIALYNNNATQPYVDEPLAGLPSYVKTGKGSALVRYDGSGDYTSVELVWAYEDQGQADASAWAAAEGGGSANLGAKGASDPIEYEIPGLNPFRQYIFRFIFTDAEGTRWSIPAPINPGVAAGVAYEIGIDFSDGGSTAGSGSEPGWNILNGNGSVSAVHDLLTSNTLPGVSIQATGISGGELTDDDVGFGHENYGNYLDTPFSDLSANDGVEAGSGAQVIISGLDDNYCYDVQVVAMPSAATTLTDLTIQAGSLSQVRTYASFRPYINNDPDPFTNSDLVLSSPLYSRPILVPAVFENATTDGAGNLAITLSDDEAIPLNAIHIAAKAMRPLLETESASIFNYWIEPVPSNQSFHVRQSTNLLAGFEAMVPPQPFTSATPQPLSLPAIPASPHGFYRVYQGSE